MNSYKSLFINKGFFFPLYPLPLSSYSPWLCKYCKFTATWLSDLRSGNIYRSRHLDICAHIVSFWLLALDHVPRTFLCITCMLSPRTPTFYVFSLFHHLCLCLLSTGHFVKAAFARSNTQDFFFPSQLNACNNLLGTCMLTLVSFIHLQESGQGHGGSRKH